MPRSPTEEGEAGRPPPPGGTDHGLRILQALRRIMRAVELHSRRLAAEHRITGPQLVCLLAVRDREPVSLSELARSVHLSSSTVIGILDRLEHKGWIRRERDRRDRRRVNAYLTEEGRRLARSAPSPLQDRLAEGFNRLGGLEKASISLALEKVVDLVEARHIDAAPLLDTGSLAPQDDPEKKEPDGGEAP